MTRLKTGSLLMLLFAAALCTSCQCITVPANDTQAPGVVLTIFFTDASGAEVSQFVNNTDHNSPLTVNVPANRSFKTFYAGSDDGGVKTLMRDWAYEKRVGPGVMQRVQPLSTPHDFSSCAKTYRAVDEDNPWQNEARRYEFSAMATDFRGNISSTAKITVVHGNF